jgi:hypothetical protein
MRTSTITTMLPKHPQLRMLLDLHRCLRLRLFYLPCVCQEYAYNTVEVAAEVTGPSGSSYIIHSLAFKTDPCAVAPAQTLPSQRYMTIIRQGARQSGLDAAYCGWLDRIPTEILQNEARRQ